MLLSRLVPVMLLVSLTLIGSRYVYDVVRQRRPGAARLAVIVVVLVGFIATAPVAWRGVLLVGGRWAMERNRWNAADVLLTEYTAWRGQLSAPVARQWAFTRMNLGNWAGAEEVLRNIEQPDAQTRLMIGLTRYYQGDPASEQLLRSVPDAIQTQLEIREYLLGRLAQKRRDYDRAFFHYGRAASFEPHFLPAVYHGARLRLLADQPDLAMRIVESFTSQFPSAANQPDINALRAAARSGSVPPDKEYEIVTF